MTKATEWPNLPTQYTRCCEEFKQCLPGFMLYTADELLISSQTLKNIFDSYCDYDQWLFIPLYLGFQTLLVLLPIWSMLKNFVKEFKSEILILSKEQGFPKYISTSQNTHTYTVTWSLSVLIMSKLDFDIFQHFLCNEIIFFLNWTTQFATNICGLLALEDSLQIGP